MKIIIVVLLLCTGSICAQNYMQYERVPDTQLVKTNFGKRINYQYKSYTIDIFSKSLRVKEGKRLIFSDVGDKNAKMIVPHLYFLPRDTTYHKILVAEFSADYSIGLGIYIINGYESRKIGFLEVAVNDTAGVNKEKLYPVSAVKNLLLQTDGNNLFISFTCNKVVANPGSDREELINADILKFVYNGKKLKEVKNF